MRHFRDIDHMIQALSEEAQKHGCTIVCRNTRIYAVISSSCECGCETVSDIDLTATAVHIWEALA
jgi:hydrogenase maturation factor